LRPFCAPFSGPGLTVCGETTRSNSDADGSLPSSSLRRSLSLTVLPVVLLAVSTGAAAFERIPKSVAVLPVRNLESPCKNIFVSGEPERVGASKLGAAVEASLSTHDDLKLVPFVTLRNKLAGTTAYKDRLVVGRERYLMGKELYNDLRQPEAEDSLRRALDLLESVYYDLVEPDAFSEILMLLAVTLVEEGKSAQALAAFKRTVLLHPNLRLPAGYHPKSVEESLILACEDVRQSLEREIPLAGADRTQDLMDRHGVDVLVLPLLTSVEDRRVLVLVLFERGQLSVSFREEVPVTDDATTAAGIDAAISRWAACTPFKRVKHGVEETHSFVLSAAYDHMLYLLFPTRTPVQSVGFSFETGYFFVPSFAIMGRFQLMYSVKDRYEDMYEEFTSARAIIGPAFSLSGTWWRVFVTPGVELNYVGSFSVTSDPDCKFFADGSDGYKANCDPDRIDNYPLQILGGVNVYLGSQFFFSNQLFLSAGASVSTYVMPFDRSIEVNFPISGEIGGGVAF